mgnify:CR=1 FL=1|jgi:uncharacterized cysteine cluster protein YcgN (CxxCxxCC family)
MRPFWETKTLEEMTEPEWEAVCDGCGRCCLHKLRYEDTDALAFTNVACRLLDLETARCGDYARRKRKVPDCVRLTPAEVRAVDWLPPTCGYRLLAEGKKLEWWHPLVSGDPETVHAAGVSIRGKAIAERRSGMLEHHIVEWPGQRPAGTRPAQESKRR